MTIEEEAVAHLWRDLHVVEVRSAMHILGTCLKEESVLLDEVAELATHVERLHVLVVIVEAHVGNGHPSLLEHVATIHAKVETNLVSLAVRETARW